MFFVKFVEFVAKDLPGLSAKVQGCKDALDDTVDLGLPPHYNYYVVIPIDPDHVGAVAKEKNAAFRCAGKLFPCSVEIPVHITIGWLYRSRGTGKLDPLL